MDRDSEILPQPHVCPLHEKYAMRVNILWGFMMFGGTFVVLACSAIGWSIADTRNNMANLSDSLDDDLEVCISESIQRDQAIATRFLDVQERVAKDALATQKALALENTKLREKMSEENNKIIRVLNVMSLNQKQTMKHRDLTYLSPDWVRDRDDD